MSENKRTVARYLDGFRAGDHGLILSCLTEDVEWEIPGVLHLVGKEAFDKEIENEAFVGRPAIDLTRLTEENDVVVAEGTVRTQRKDGGILELAFADVFLMERGQIKRLISYLMEIDAPRPPALSAPGRTSR
jgi:ketosteroid isomerase-like protein